MRHKSDYYISRTHDTVLGGRVVMLILDWTDRTGSDESDRSRWLSFLSGLPERERKRRLLMPAQAFVDDSGGKGTSRHFVLAGLVGHSDSWLDFSDEWAGCLQEPPRIETFKMREAASCGGQFYGISEQHRDAKLRRLAHIVNRHARLLTYSVIDLDAHADTWGRTLQKPRNEPYFWPFHNTIMATCFSLWDAGWRERFEIVFDENVVFGPRAKIWYPVMRAVCQHREPEAASILPADPVFRTDDDFLPIQAADLFAWCIRKSTDDPLYDKFGWILGEIPNVQLSEYAQYYDKERMEAVWQESLRLAREGEIPDDLEMVYQEVIGQL